MRPILKISLFLYVALLLAPGALQSAHIFANHQHVFCDHSADSHIHQSGVDCELFNFQQHSFLDLQLTSLSFPDPEEFFFTPVQETSLLPNRHILNLSLRGPPVFIG